MTVVQLYQSQEHTCSCDDAELIAFNPDAADNTRVFSLTQSTINERERTHANKRKRQGKEEKNKNSMYT